MLKSMTKGWRHFESEYITRTAKRVESPAFMLGTAIHAALLEPRVFAREYVTCPDECSDRRTKAYKEWAALVDGRIILTTSERAMIDRVCESCIANASIERILTASGQVECEFFWHNEVGVDCRAKVDKAMPSVVVDVKTTEDATPQAFARTIGMYRYDLQAVHYLEATGADTFLFLAVEKTEPFRARLYELCQADLADAREMRRELLIQYRSRLEANDWSEPNETEVQTLFLPSYLK
jgi:exodeoxyribonuclease VIII